jgi:hypothetical protein
MAIMMITTPIKMLKVNKKSNKNDGSGKISIAMIRRTMSGIPKPESSIFDMSCRSVDISAEAIKKSL